MKFTQAQIITALNAETGSTSGFPYIVKAMKTIGVSQYTYDVTKGMYRYTDGQDTLTMQLNGTPQTVAKLTPTAAQVQSIVQEAQNGKFEFEGFTAAAGKIGVPYWTVDMAAMTTTYYDQAEQPVLVEPIAEV